jgi:hypothetical protein
MPGPWAVLSGWWLVDNGNNVPVSANDVTEATPSALTGGNAFTVTWDGG